MAPLGYVYESGARFEIVAGGLDTAARIERQVAEALRAIPGVREVTTKHPRAKYTGTPGGYVRAELPE